MDSGISSEQMMLSGDDNAFVRYSPATAALVKGVSWCSPGGTSPISSR